MKDVAAWFVALALQAGVVWLVWAYLLVAAFDAPPLTYLQCALVAVAFNFVRNTFAGPAQTPTAW